MPLLERICVRDLVDATGLSVLRLAESVPAIGVAAASVTEQVDEDDIQLIPGSPWVDTTL